jgi:hypothetical protein
MGSDQRRQIAWEAARLICYHEEPDRFRARWKAALRVLGANVRQSDLPTDREIQDEILKLERSLERDGADSTRRRSASDAGPDRFRLYAALLAPLEKVRESPKSHPEGDVLYHSLQVFELARQELPYDEEFLLAALLHDVGKAIDPKEHIAAALTALETAITARTAWLIEHRGEAQTLHEGRLGARCLRRLEASEDFAELLLLADCDRRGRTKGAPAPELIDALEYLRELNETNGD